MVEPAGTEQRKYRVPRAEYWDSRHRWQIDATRALDVEGKRFLDVLCHRGARKTTWAINTLIRECVAHPMRSYGYIAPTHVQAMKVVWIEPTMLFRWLPDREIIPWVENKTDGTITFPNKSVLGILGADKPDSIRGLNAYGYMVDEFAECKDNLWPEILQPIMRRTDESGHGQRWCGFCYTSKGVATYAYQLRQMTLQDPEWYHVTIKASESGILAPEELEATRRTTPKALYLQEYECFPPGMHIATNRGQVQIQDVKVGDVVLTHAGRWRPVYKTMSRGYNGDLVVIKTAANQVPIRCTPNHPFRVFHRTTQTYEWVPAEKLKHGDCCVMPRLLPQVPLVSEDVSRILGWYVTEGSVAKTAVQFGLGHEEGGVAAQLDQAFRTQGINTVAVKTRSGITVTANSARYADMCARTCGSGAANKRIPWDLIGGHERMFFDTIMKGDGCRHNDRLYTYTTVSKTLAYDVQMLAGMLGYSASVRSIPARSSTIEGRNVSCLESYSVQIRKPKCKPNSIYPARHGIGVKIVTISREPYSGPVYNIDVSWDHSYVVEGRVCHNCEDLVEEAFTLVTSAMLMSLPYPLPAGTASCPRKKRIISCDPAMGGDACVIYVFDGLQAQPPLVLYTRNLDQVYAQLVKTSKETGIVDFIVDSIGIGEGVCRDLEKHDEFHVQRFCSSEEGVADTQVGNKRAALWWYVKGEIEAGRVERPVDRETLRQLPYASRYKVRSGKIWMMEKAEIKKLLGCSPDHAEAWAMGLYGLKRANEYERRIPLLDRWRRKRYRQPEPVDPMRHCG